MARKSTLKDMIYHLAATISMAGGMVLFFFFAYLPSTTNHGETVTVPDVIGMSIDELDEYIVKRGLRFEVNDSSYSDNQDPLTVLKQFPKPGSKVKENRKIILTLNRVEPPYVPVPDLVDRPLKNAQVVLKSNELNIGNISYVPDLAFNAVITMKFNGKKINSGERIPKGSTLDLEVGNGYGNRVFPLEDLKGRPFEEAKYLLMGIGLVVRNIKNLGDSTDSPGYIYKQYPKAKRNIRVGNSVDLWVVPKYDTSKFEMYEKQFDKLDSLERIEGAQ